MNSSKLVKFAVGLALAMGLLASFANNSASNDTDEIVAEAPTAPIQPAETMVETIKPANRSAARVKKPTLSKQYKEALARRGEEIENTPPNWGERGLPPTDSSTTTVVKRTPK